LWVQAAVHGDEPGGAIGILRALGRFDPSVMTGSIIAIMAANPTAFRSQTRNTPYDGDNMNRCFGRDQARGHTRGSATVLIDTALSVADVVLDLHSGGNVAIVPFYSIYREDGSAASRESALIAAVTGAKTAWACTDTWLEGALFSNVVMRNKPAVLVECGGGGPVALEHAENFAHAIESVARYLGIVPGARPAAVAPRLINGCSFVYSQYGGFFEPLVAPGETVRAGQPVGRTLSPYGEILEELVAPVGPAYIASILRPYLPIHSGTEVAEAIRVLEGAQRERRSG
jgi:predicted deacylase